MRFRKNIEKRIVVGSSPQGFTIIELMIALSVLSVILIASTIILIQIGVIYTKGNNAASLQNAARSVQDDAAAAIRFGGFGPVPVSQVEGGLTVNAICIGPVRYSFVLNKELGLDSATGQTTYHVLWRDTRNDPTGGCAPVAGFDQPGDPGGGDSNNDGYEMAASHTRLSKFDITPDPTVVGTYNINIWMEYGDSDLLNLTTNPPSCKGGNGEQFCAVSNLTATATNRIVGG